MTGILNLLMGTVRSAVATDPYFEYTTLLLPGSGTNGAQNNTFLDGSTNNFTITRNGNTTQGTFSPFSQTGWSYYLPEQASNQVNFTTSAGTDFQFAGDFTIEGWLYPVNNSGDGSIYVVSDNVNYLAFNISISANVFNIYLNNISPTSITSDIALDTWTHVAMVRSGSGTGNIKLYTNGVLKGSITNTSTLGYANPILSRIGGGVSGINRYYSNLRICKSAVYTTAFTPSTLPLTTTSQGATNCVLLTANANRFVNQAAGATATITGSPTVVAFSPFNPTASWSAATYGGSGYFDGSGDSLTCSSILPATSDFTLSFWVYPTSLAGYVAAIRQADSGNIFQFFIGYADGHPGIQIGSVYADYTAGVIKAGQWQYIQVVKSSSAYTVYVNGTALSVTASSGNIGTTSIASGTFYVQYNTGCYFSDVRVVTSALSNTVPTAPLTAITNTSLLLNFTNAGIYDATSKNDLETVGNAQISNAITPKWGSTSIKFDGTGDYLLAPVYSSTNIPNTFFSPNGPFTVECWINPNSLSTRSIVGYSSTTSTIWVLQFNGSSKVAFKWVNTTPTVYTVTSTSSISTGVWTYVAAIYDGSNIKIYVNGTLEATTATTGSLRSASNVIFGVGSWGGSITDPTFDGYIQDLRITNGIARTITASPTAAFPTL